MKKIKQLSMIGLVLVFVMSSCSVQKRVYTRGLNIEWFKHKNTSEKNGLTENRAKKAEKQQTAVAEQTVDNSNIAAQIEEINSNMVPTNNAVVVADNNKATTVSTPKVHLKSDKLNSQVSAKELKSAAKTFLKSNSKQAFKAARKTGGDVPVGLLYVLCFLIPWLAVGLVTDWDIKVVIINLLWTLLCGIPGIIHALIVVSRES